MTRNGQLPPSMHASLAYSYCWTHRLLAQQAGSRAAICRLLINSASVEKPTLRIAPVACGSGIRKATPPPLDFPCGDLGTADAEAGDIATIALRTAYLHVASPQRSKRSSERSPRTGNSLKRVTPSPALTSALTSARNGTLSQFGHVTIWREGVLLRH